MHDLFVPEVPNFEITDEIVRFWWPGHSGFAHLRTARLAHARLGKVIAEYEAKRAEVVPMRKRGHAARS